jgi:hypothetical protein
MEYHSLPTTGTSKVAGIIDGQPYIPDMVHITVHQSTALYVGTLIFIAVSIGTVLYGVL